MKRTLYSAALTLTLLFWLVIPAFASPPTDILNDALCYGELSECRITPEQAEAFIQTLENLEIKEGEQADDVLTTFYYSDIRAALCDVEGNGIPALLVYYDTKSDSPDWSDWAGEHWENVYLWYNNQVSFAGKIESRTLGIGPGERYLHFGKNNTGAYSWSQWSRSKAGACTYTRVFTVKDGTLKENVSVNDYDFETETTTITIDGVIKETLKGVFSLDENTLALEKKLLEEIGAPIGEPESHFLRCSAGIPVQDMLSSLKSYIDSAATAVPPEETSEPDNTTLPEKTTDLEAMSDTQQKSDFPQSDISQSEQSPELADTSVKDNLPAKYILWISSAAGVIILCTALLLILKKRMTKRKG